MFMCWVVIVAEKCDANLFSDNPCFARTRSCQYQQRLPRVQNGATLFVVERGKIGRIIRRLHLLIVAEMRVGVSQGLLEFQFYGKIISLSGNAGSGNVYHAYSNRIWGH